MSEPTPRIALVTGGSRGLGAGLVDAFLEAGYCVETCARTTTDTVKAWAEDPELKERFHFSAVDVSDPSDAERFVKEAAARWGGLDVLVNNAGVAREGVIGLFGDDALDQVVDLNLKGTVYVTESREPCDVGPASRCDRQHLLGRGALGLPRALRLRSDQGGARRTHPGAGPRARDRAASP